MATTTINRSPSAASRTTGVLSAPLWRLVDRLAGGGPRGAASELRDLSADQLHDAGIDLAKVFPGPVFPVDATTMTRLMSLR